MIKLTKGSKPAVLATNEVKWTGDFATAQAARDSTSAAATRYRHPDIKAAIQVETSGKCAYCESFVRHVYPGDVEHVLPKSHRPDLVVAWDNLTYVCSVCNNAKGNYYDLNSPLVNPYEDEPRDHLRFFGPNVFHDTDQGFLTRRTLKLCRGALVERRKEKLERIQTLIDLYHRQPDGQVKDQLASDIRGEAEPNAEYSAAARDFILGKLGWNV
jgi:5-methylcytosine-specific restriction endonuclease McrA